MRKAFLIVGLGTILSSATTSAATMGPPLALMGENQWGVGIEYGRQNIDLEADGTLTAHYTAQVLPITVAESLKIEDLTTDMIFGTLAYGVWDDWDVFVRLGATNVDADVSARGFDVLGEFGGVHAYDLGNVDGSFGFAWGVGTRATFHRWGPWAVGGLAQFTWYEPGDADVTYTDPLMGAGAVHTGEVSLDYWTIQLSLAASYQVDAWQFWAGPFLQLIRGDLDRRGDIAGLPGDTFRASADLEEESQIGGHIGATWDVADEWNVWAEGQLTGDSWLIGLGLVFLPGRSNM